MRQSADNREAKQNRQMRRNHMCLCQGQTHCRQFFSLSLSHSRSSSFQLLLLKSAISVIWMRTKRIKLRRCIEKERTNLIDVVTIEHFIRIMWSLCHHNLFAHSNGSDRRIKFKCNNNHFWRNSIDICLSSSFIVRLYQICDVFNSQTSLWPTKWQKKTRNFQCSKVAKIYSFIFFV